MRYVIACEVRGAGGEFNNNLRKELFEKFKVRSSKLPAHFTIKAPFEYDKDIIELEEAIKNVCENSKVYPFEMKGYGHFDNRVIYMNVDMSKEGKEVHDKLIDDMSKLPYIEFTKTDGKDKVFHVTLASKKLQPIYDEVLNYIEQYPCDFKCNFDNVIIYKWQDNTWKVYKEFKMYS